MQFLPWYIPSVFILTTLFSIFQFYKASGGPRAVLWLLLLWISIQAAIALTGFYTHTEAMPPRLLFLLAPPLLMIIVLFTTTWGRRFLDRLDPAQLTLLHVVRVPVEMVLFWLANRQAVPVLMTFEGRNFDILSGLTAPLIWYLVFVNKKLNRSVLLVWNILCLGLLINIVVHAVLSVPLPFQQLAFDRPNVAVLHFPFVWLPGCVVPLVLLSHLAVLRQLVKSRRI